MIVVAIAFLIVGIIVILLLVIVNTKVNKEKDVEVASSAVVSDKAMESIVKSRLEMDIYTCKNLLEVRNSLSKHYNTSIYAYSLVNELQDLFIKDSTLSGKSPSVLPVSEIYLLLTGISTVDRLKFKYR